MIPSIFFNRQDRELLRMINDTLDNIHSDIKQQPTIDINLHPHGILELTTTREFRVAHAVINLLTNIEKGKAKDRLYALQALHDEVLHSARTTFRYNTGRVLIQIMKDIVRSRGDENHQLKLVHDFRRTAEGNPNIVRKMLTKHHLLEMPEKWNQLTMDHHVHDSNTKGRKNATHLIMDAWVKGIRKLTVVYYNYVEPEIAREVLQAASIVGIIVRIGIEFQIPFHNRFIRVVWAPRGFSDPESFLTFLAEKPVYELMEKGKQVSQWMQQNVLAVLNIWNTKYRLELANELEITIPEIQPQEFLAFVGQGQTSLLHLTECIHKKLLPLLYEKTSALKKEMLIATPEQVEQIMHHIYKMNMITIESISERWITPNKNPEIANLFTPDHPTQLPELLKLSPYNLLKYVSRLRSGYRITLQLAKLTAEDVLELLWDCKGMITHLELFNLKEWQQGHLIHLAAINELQLAINDPNILRLKQLLVSMIRRLELLNTEASYKRYKKFIVILRNLPILQAPYKISPLRSRIGTDSTSNSNLRHGMGLAALQTLPASSRRVLAKKQLFNPMILPVHVPLAFQKTWIVTTSTERINYKILSFLRKLPGLRMLGRQKKEEWQALANIKIKPYGNIITMGGIGSSPDNGIYLKNIDKKKQTNSWPNITYLNTKCANLLKIIIGFVPATLAFLYTQEWWVLAWFGSTIWFVITGIRNIAQAILGGGSFSKTSLLRWKNFISWSRICDSLMYTGLSVVLLELIIHDLILQKTFGFTLSNHYIIVFTVIAICNSLYIAGHNILRGFPKEAIIGNLFRSVFAVPLSILYNDILIESLLLFNIANPLAVLQPGAAIISKSASDTVAGVIEGLADKNNNYRLRSWDYKTKLEHFFNWYTKLELRFPDLDILSLLSKPYELFKITSKEAPELQRESIINALDFMYFWMYQPYAQQTFRSILNTMTREEKIILAKGQNVLLLVQEVSQLFIDGYMGKNFARALSFYLTSHETYINSIVTAIQHKTYNITLE